MGRMEAVMNIKQAIAQTQRRWIHFCMGKNGWESCGFCRYAMGRCSTPCPVLKVLGKPCGGLPNYSAWDEADELLGEKSPETRRLARLVLEDVNKIARAYHVKQVEVPQ